MNKQDIINLLRESKDYVEDTKLARFGVAFKCNRGIIMVQNDGFWINDYFCSYLILNNSIWSFDEIVEDAFNQYQKTYNVNINSINRLYYMNL